MITLREDQETFVSAIRASLRKTRRVMAVAPCGFGKTVCFSYMAMRASQRGVAVNLVVHRKELVDQISATLRRFDVAHGIVAAGYAADPRQLVQVSSVFSLARRLDRVRKPGLLVIDEGHHACSGTTWGDVIAHWNDVPTIAVTATPWRLSGEGFDDLFGDMVIGPTARWLIDNGHLSRYRLFAPSTMDTSNLHKRAGEFVREEVEELTMKATIVGSAVEHYEKILNGAPTIAFCVSVKAAHSLAESFKARGWRAAAVDGAMPDDERNRIIRDCRAGALNVMTSCALVGEGLDCGSLKGGILLNPTASLGKYVQEVMRPMRAAPGKDEAIILDHVGNAMRHGLPDADREWSLQGREKRKAVATETPIRTCPACYRSLPAATAKCPCGYIFEAQPREVEQVDGELAEVDILAQRRERITQQTAAKTMDELIAVGQRRGMKNPEGWAAHVFSARMAKQNRRTA